MGEQVQYISLQEATQYCSYSRDYLKLRARQGKLKAVKIGRNWITKKEWVKEYVERIEEYNNNNLHTEKFVALPKNLPVKPLSRQWSFFQIRQPRFALIVGLAFVLLTAGIVSGKESLRNVYQDLEPYTYIIGQAGDIIVHPVRDFVIDATKEISAGISNGVESTAKLLSETISDIPHSFANVSEAVDNTFSMMAEKVLKPGQELAAISSPDVLKSTLDTFKEYGNWISETFKSGYLTINNFTKEKLDNASRTVFSGLKSFTQGIKEIPQTLVSGLFKKEIVIEKPEEEFAKKEEMEELL